MKQHYGCPVQATIQMLSGKWKVSIVWHLSFGQLRFAELRKKVVVVMGAVVAAYAAYKAVRFFLRRRD